MATNFANGEEYILIDSDVIRERWLAYAILLDYIRLFHNHDHLNPTPEEPYFINIDEASRIRWIKKEEFKKEYDIITKDCWLYSSREWEDGKFYFFF